MQTSAILSAGKMPFRLVLFFKAHSVVISWLSPLGFDCRCLNFTGSRDRRGEPTTAVGQ